MMNKLKDDLLFPDKSKNDVTKNSNKRLNKSINLSSGLSTIVNADDLDLTSVQHE